MNIKQQPFGFHVILIPFLAFVLVQCGQSGSSGGSADAPIQDISVIIEDELVTEDYGELEGQGKVSLSSLSTTDLEIFLFSSSSLITVPDSVTVPAGESSVFFEVIIDGDDEVGSVRSSISVTASASGWTTGIDEVEIDEDDCNSTLLAEGIYSFDIEADDVEQDCLDLPGNMFEAYINSIEIPDVTLPAGTYTNTFPYYFPDSGIELPLLGFVESSIDLGENGQLDIRVESSLQGVEINLLDTGAFGTVGMTLSVADAIICTSSNDEVLVYVKIAVDEATLNPPLVDISAPCEMSFTMTGTRVE